MNIPLINKIVFAKNSSVYLNKLKSEALQIREKNELLAVSPQNTFHHWLGIKNAALGLFPDNLLILPQQYSNSLLTHGDLEKLASFLANLNFKGIVYNGFPEYFVEIIKVVHKANSAVKQYLLFAGPASEYCDYDQRRKVAIAVDLCRSNAIFKLGFNKKGLAEAFSEIYNIRTGSYMVKTKHTLSVPKTIKDSTEPQIGVFGSDNFNKNLHTQVIAALMIKNSVVHVLDKKVFSYLQTDRIKDENGLMEHERFVQKLRDMDICLYLSFSESWGLVATESLSVGTPCLTTGNSDIYDYDDYLQKYLVVQDYDNVLSIKKQIDMVLSDYAELSRRTIEYSKRLHDIADIKLQEFLDN
ncbi:MAG: glycosyltransferase [Chitinophagales bacterium]|nr:glycosyltransferase [Chitinophagales bacterium]